MTGEWNAYKAPRATSVMRSLHRLVHARFGISPSTWHVRSHKGEPGNELVDALAADAAQHGGMHDVAPFLEAVLDPAFVRALEWTWMLFEPNYRSLWEGHCLRVPKHPSTTPEASVFPEVPRASEQEDSLNCQLSCKHVSHC